MGQIKTIKGKVAHKHEIEADWLLSSYVPEHGEIITYDPDAHLEGEKKGTRTVPQIEIGDGEKLVKDLPFSTLPVEWDPIYGTPII
jgi:hypothetical protein